MLPKSKRVNLKREYQWIRQGKKIETASFKCFYRMGVNNFPRVGIALSTRIFKKAVLRSKAKRVTSKIIENLYPGLQTNLNLVIMPKLGVLEKDNDLLKNEILLIKELYFNN